MVDIRCLLLPGTSLKAITTSTGDQRRGKIERKEVLSCPEGSTHEKITHLQWKRANGWPSDCVARCAKDTINQARVCVAVRPFHQITGWLWRIITEHLGTSECCRSTSSLEGLTYFIEIKREFPWNGAVESRLQEGRPPVTEAVRAALVPLADARHSAIHSLRELKRNKRF